MEFHTPTWADRIYGVLSGVKVDGSGPNICLLVSRPTRLNILTYAIATTLFCISCAMWIYGSTRSTLDEGDIYKTRAYIVGVTGAIVVALLWGFGMIIHEVLFNRKCSRFSEYIQNLQTQFAPDRLAANIAAKTSRAATQTMMDVVIAELKKNGIDVASLKPLLESFKTQA